MFRRRGGLVLRGRDNGRRCRNRRSGRHRQDQRYAAQDQEAYDQQMAAQQAAAAGGTAQLDYTAELEQLAQLKAQGILTDEEFEAKKKISESDVHVDPRERRTSARSRLSVPGHPLDDVHLLPVHHLDLDPHHGVRGHLPAEGCVRVHESRVDRS